jgi:hypothetical protein
MGPHEKQFPISKSSMKIYKIRNNPNFRRVELDRRKFGASSEFLQYIDTHLQFKGVPIKDWQPPDVKADYPAFPAPDFWSVFGGGRGDITAGQKAVGLVETFLVRAGQLLPLPFQGETLIICNVLECQDCIDEDKSEWYVRKPSGERGYITRPFFLPNEVPASNIFKIPQVIDGIYTWEEDSNPEDEFKSCVEANGLTGLYFEPVWSDEEGIIPYKLPVF